MFFKKKKKASKKEERVPKQEDLSNIFDEKNKENGKLDKVSDEIIAKAIKDLLSKD